MEPLLMDKIISRVFEELSNDQRKEIMKLFDAKKEAEALEKIEKMIPDYDNFLEEVFQEFAEEYLRTVN
jgi:Mg/Co/Ni transporter MgtE